LAAIAAAEHVGVPPDVSARALGRFQNVRRRMEVSGRVSLGHGEVTVYDDFAHHPTAIRTTLDGLKLQMQARAQGGRILAAFEPRSNTMKLGAMKAQLPWSLESADLSFCHSGGLDWDAAQALSPLGNKASVYANVDALVLALCAAAKPGDQIVCMSNGSFGGIHAKLLKSLQAATGR